MLGESLMLGEGLMLVRPDAEKGGTDGETRGV